MNRHFNDAWYYLKRAVENAMRGVREELEPVEERARELTGRESEPEPGRMDRMRLRLRELQTKVEAEAREMAFDARRRFRSYRQG